MLLLRPALLRLPQELPHLPVVFLLPLFPQAVHLHLPIDLLLLQAELLLALPELIKRGMKATFFIITDALDVRDGEYPYITKEELERLKKYWSK